MTPGPTPHCYQVQTLLLPQEGINQLFTHSWFPQSLFKKKLPCWNNLSSPDCLAQNPYFLLTWHIQLTWPPCLTWNLVSQRNLHFPQHCQVEAFLLLPSLKLRDKKWVSVFFALPPLRSLLFIAADSPLPHPCCFTKKNTASALRRQLSQTTLSPLHCSHPLTSQSHSLPLWKTPLVWEIIILHTNVSHCPWRF